MNPYSELFYHDMKPTSYKSAKLIVPYIKKLLNPASVLDIGCGSGEWLAEFLAHGIKDVYGLDGSWARNDLSISSDYFKEWDLEEVIHLNKKYDLAISLEVGEHLPDESSDQLVASLVAHSDNIIFSAAVPGQYGTLHQNEQYIGYWANKFRNGGYIPVDCLRPQFWNMEGVEYWYAQNMVLYTRNRELAFKLQKVAFPLTPEGLPFSLIHPTLQSRNKKYLELLMDPVHYPMSKFVKALPKIIANRIKKWIFRS